MLWWKQTDGSRGQRWQGLSLALAGLIVAGGVLMSYATGHSRGSSQNRNSSQAQAKITIDYPLEGSIFPPEITPPTVLFRDSSSHATKWMVEIAFADHSPAIRAEAKGEPMQMGEIDPAAGEGGALSPEQASTRTWKPSPEMWETIKRQSVKSPAQITILGFSEGGEGLPVSRGTVTISTSADPVGAPVFYRDVPLMISPPSEKGVIQPLPPSAIPLIKWRLRNIGDAQSRTVMEDLPTCANCHSFSGDGRTLGIDVDGPKNDKGLYALVSVTKNTVMRNQDVIRWSSFQENQDPRNFEPAVKRFGFMSQVSPDGRYVVTSIGPPDNGNAHQKENPGFVPGLSDRLFSTTYRDINFLQVFYPTRGILVWYDRTAQKLRPLPGADDPRYVHTSAFWSPDGKFLIFSRAKAFDPYPPGAPKPVYANDPNEPQIQYDLYKIPFNDGRGGKAEPIAGASGNGMSNNFPKVSPDGRWIVFVQNHSGLLMRPDSRLFIVPFAGGKARLMNCNTPLMNSWHTFSPNGRWLAFSSKGRSPYTQLMLTHIDASGNDSPAVLVENTTAGNRAVNIPEFVNIAGNGLEKIDPQATEFYRLFNRAFELMENNQMAEAIPVMRAALERDPDDALAHYGLATALSATNQERAALGEYEKACALNPRIASWFAHLAISLALNGNMEDAIVNWRKSLAIDPSSPGTQTDLGSVLMERGQTDEGLQHLRKAVELAPRFAEGRNHLGMALAKTGKNDEAIAELQAAVELEPRSAEYAFDLGYVLTLAGKYQPAIAPLEKSVELSGGNNWQCFDALAQAYAKLGKRGEAMKAAETALELAVREGDAESERKLREQLERYRETM